MKTEEEIDAILYFILSEIEKKPKDTITSFEKGMIAGICLVADRIEGLED